MVHPNANLTIYHGDHQINSRRAYIDVIEQSLAKNITINRYDGKKVRPEEIHQSLEGSSLFGSDTVVAIEGFITRPKSKDKISMEKALTSSTSPAYLWENKKLTSTQLNAYKGAKIIEFKIPPVIFNFLDSLGVSFTESLSRLDVAMKADSPGGVFYMLCRHIRLLIQASDPNQSLPPWQKSKLLSQLKKLTLAKILYTHKSLTLLDYHLKTGQSALSLEAELELLIGRLYYGFLYEKV